VNSLSRRHFVGGGLGAIGAAGVVSALPTAMQKAVAEAAENDRPGSLSQIEHVVVFMQENRSFDTYFGTLPGVLDLDHHWPTQHSAWDNGKNDNWLPAHRAADGDAAGVFTMAYYTRADLPFHYALADAFTICDNCHCSVLGPTNPNRLYGWTGSIDPDGKNGGPVVDNSEYVPYTWTTYAEMLQAGGVSWRNYQEPDTGDDNPLAWFKQFQTARPARRSTSAA
jgi:phospholipase C